MPKISVLRSSTALLSLSAALVLSPAARADVTISSAATHGMSCSNGVCAPTARKAVLNVGDLETMLSSGNVEVTTTNSGVQANNIVVDDATSWSAASALTLDAYQSVSINKAIPIQGQGGLTLTTNDGGANGTLIFGHKGSVTFANLSSNLTINGTTYTLVNTIKSLASAIAANPSGTYALASDYDAGLDGTYTSVPIPTPFTGTFEELGNTISDLTIDDVSDTEVGLFAEVDTGGAIVGVSMNRASVVASNNSCAAPLVGYNEGIIIGSHASGSVAAGGAGGLVCGNIDGSIRLSSASTAVTGAGAGGLVATTLYGSIDQSYAVGKAVSKEHAGDLVAENSGGIITNCYATGSTQSKSLKAFDGGFASQSDESGTTSYSYSTGRVGPQTRYPRRGGFVGTVSEGAAFTDDYWDTDKSGFTNLNRGAGNVRDQPGIKGLSTKELQSALPPGFDLSIWGETEKINDGLPYLIANPPRN